MYIQYVYNVEYTHTHTQHTPHKYLSIFTYMVHLCFYDILLVLQQLSIDRFWTTGEFPISSRNQGVDASELLVHCRNAPWREGVQSRGVARCGLGALVPWCRLGVLRIGKANDF